MKKNLLWTFLMAVLALLSQGNALAQAVSFTNPDDFVAKHDFRVTIPTGTASAANGVPFPVSYKSTSVAYNVSLYRRPGFNDQAYIRIYSGTQSNPTANLLSNDVVSSPASSTSNTTNKWGPFSSKADVARLSGTFSTANIASTDAGLFAVFVFTTGPVGDT